MNNPPPQRPSTLRLLIALVIFLVAPAFFGLGFMQRAEPTTHDPWNKTQVIMPEELAKLLSEPGSKKPLVVCVGFEFLYKGGHIAGAQFIGPDRDAKGIDALKKWATGIERDQEVVLYCGCCPFKECPNIRPAFLALSHLGITRLKVLYLENNFAKDWMGKGLPSEKGPEKQ